jgi:hypothetical protein
MRRWSRLKIDIPVGATPEYGFFFECDVEHCNVFASVFKRLLCSCDRAVAFMFCMKVTAMCVNYSAAKVRKKRLVRKSPRVKSGFACVQEDKTTFLLM